MGRKKTISVNDIMDAVSRGETDFTVPYKYEVDMPGDKVGRRLKDTKASLFSNSRQDIIVPELPKLKTTYFVLDTDTIVDLSEKEFDEFMSHFEIKCIEMYNKGLIQGDDFESIIETWGQDIWEVSQEEDYAYRTIYVLIQVFNDSVKKSNEKGYLLGIVSNEFGRLGGLKEAKLREFYAANIDYDAGYHVMKKYLTDIYKKYKLIVFEPSSYKKKSHMLMGTDTVDIWETWED